MRQRILDDPIKHSDKIGEDFVARLGRVFITQSVSSSFPLEMIVAGLLAHAVKNRDWVEKVVRGSPCIHRPGGRGFSTDHYTADGRVLCIHTDAECKRTVVFQ